MPIRIRPVYDLGPCVLDLESIKSICALVDKEFPAPAYSAEDGIWEIYNERSDIFIKAISTHKRLDTFRVHATLPKSTEVFMIERSKVKSVELSFTRREASVKLRGSNEDMHWFEHFMMDLRRSVRRPRFSERGLGRKFLIIILSGLASTLPVPIQDEGLPSGAPYSIIILQQEPPSPLIEGIKVNLISNVIWVVAAFVAGIVLTAFIAWMYVNYGVNLNDLVPTPSIPTITPMP